MPGPTLDELPRMSDLSGSMPRYTQWLSNFNSNMTPLNSGADSTTVASINTAWTTAYGLITNVATRIHKNIIDARVLRFGNAATPGGHVATLRAIIKRIQANSSATAGQLAAAGLCPHINRRSLPEIPTAGPALVADRSAPHTLTIRYRQEGQAETSKKKPPGCKACLLKWVADNGASGSMSFSKTPCNIDVGAALTGHRVSVQGVWVMGNSKESPPGNVLIVGVP